jgi:predicted small lipoprotein YifL
MYVENNGSSVITELKNRKLTKLTSRSGGQFPFTLPIHFILPILLVALAISLAGCGQAGPGSMTLKWPGMDKKEMPVKSSYAFAVTKTFTDINNKITTAATYQVFAANYDLDSATFGQSLNKPMTADDNVRVTFSLVGDEGGNEKTAAKAGDYSAKADKFMKLETVGIVTRKGGTDSTLWLDRSALTGNVKVTSVSGDTMTGEVDLTSGESAIKGPFTAKILVRK